MKKKAEAAEKKNGLFLAVAIVFILAVVLTWIIKGGSFQGAEFVKADYTRLGLHEIFTVPFYSVYYFVIQIVLLFAIAMFYGVVSKTSGYKSLVSKFAKFLKGKEIAFALVTSLLVAIFTAFSSQWLVVLIFMPLLISICAELKMDKIAAFSLSFGSILVGVLGATYGTEVVSFFVYYAGSKLTDLMVAKWIIFAIAYIGFNAFTVLRLISVKKNKNALELVDPLANDVEVKKASTWPMIVLFAVLFVIMVLGFVNWNSIHETKIFTDLLTKINEVHIGKDFFIFKYLLGNVAAFGAFALEASIVLLSIATIIVTIVYGVKIDELFENMIDGIKAFIKPILLVPFAYCVFIVVYMSPFIPTITNAITDANSKLAPFLVSVVGMITSLFNVDYGFTAYNIGGFFASIFPKDVSAVSLVFTSMYGLMMFVLPTSIGLIFGLQYVGISYKTWLKHIWKFALPMFVILEIIYFIIL